MAPLDPSEYAPGRQINAPDGTPVNVVDTLTGSSGNTYLIITDPNPENHNTGLVSVADVRGGNDTPDDEAWSAVDPEDRVTGVPDVTDPDEDPDADPDAPGA